MEYLIEHYSKENKDFIYDNREIIKYDNIIKDGLNLNLKLVHSGESYILFFFIFSQSKILLNLPLAESLNDLSATYDIILDSLKNMGLAALKSSQLKLRLKLQPKLLLSIKLSSDKIE